VLAALVGCLVFGNSLHAEDNAELTLAIQKLREWRQSFATIRVVWHSWNYNDFVQYYPKFNPEESLGKTFYSEREFAWADIGAMKQELRVFKEGRIEYRDALGSDGTRPWSAETRHGRSQEHWDLIQLAQPEPNRPLKSNLVLDGLYGLWGSSGHWVSERLANASQAKVQGHEEVDGIDCLVIQNKSDIQEEVFWLDPQHSYLPRRVRFSGLNSEHVLTVFYTWQAVEFQLVENATWFPMSGTLRPLDYPPPQFQWFVRKVAFNEPLTRADFAPPPGTPGVTRIIDRVNNSVTRVGSSKADNSPNGNSAQANAASQGSVIATPTVGLAWRWFGVVAGCLLVVGVLGWRYLESRRER
jgi:hypothetical protein